MVSLILIQVIDINIYIYIKNLENSTSDKVKNQNLLSMGTRESQCTCASYRHAKNQFLRGIRS
jgi:hypothetical protein